jgi:succinoglycan biosynthesis transport protein ExoP
LIVSLPGLERELRQLEQDVKDALSTYEIVDKTFKEADIKYSYEVPDVRLVSEAVPPLLPSSPLRGTITLAALLGGLVAAAGLAFFLEYLNPRVRGVQDIEDFVGVKVLTTIPHISRRRWRLAGLS